MTPQPLKNIKNRKILLDSNILIHYATEGFIERSGNPLRVLKDNNNELAVAPITGFELLNTTDKEDDRSAKLRSKYVDFLNYLDTIQMQVVYFQNAASLSRMYLKICERKNIPVPDLLLGSIVVTHSKNREDAPLFLTTDRDDFCEPLWWTVSHLEVSGDSKRKNKSVHLYLLEFNQDFIKEVSRGQ